MTRRATRALALAVVVLAASGCLPAALVWTSTSAGTGTAGYAGDEGPAVAAALNRPTNLVVDPDGNVFVTDLTNMRIRRIDADGTITTVAGTGVSGYSGDGGPAVDAKLSAPQGLGLDAAGNLYVADGINNRVRRIDTAGIITTVAGTGTSGYSGDGGPASAAQLSFPSGLAVAADGTFYVSDANHVVRRVAADGTITTVAGTGVAGFGGDSGSATAAQLNGPAGLALDGAGNLYVADRNNNRVRRVDGAGIITTVVGNGQSGFAGDYGSATAAFVGSPGAVAIAPDGNLLVSQGSYHVVRLVVLQAGVILPFAGVANSFGYSGDDGPPTAAQLFFPAGVAAEPSGDVLIADSGNNRVRAVRTGGSIGGDVTVTSGAHAGLTVRLYDAADTSTPILTTTTDANGIYGFQVRPGDYVVEFVGAGSVVGEWWNDAADQAGATTITIARGTLHRADAALGML